jgi:hypothetical protein
MPAGRRVIDINASEWPGGAMALNYRAKKIIFHSLNVLTMKILQILHGA